MKPASVLIMFGLLFTVCASASGHRLVRVDRYRYDKLSDYEVYQYDDSVLVSHTLVFYSKDYNDTIYYTYQTNQVGDITEEVTYMTAVRKKGVEKSKFVSRSDGTHSSYALAGDEWFEWGRSRSDEQGRTLELTDGDRHYSYTYDSLGRRTVERMVFTDKGGDVVRKEVDSVAYSADGLQLTNIRTSQEGDSAARIYAIIVKTFDKKGRMISEEQFDPYENDDEHPSLNIYRYRYPNKRCQIGTSLAKEFKRGKYKERPYLKLKYVYNKRGLRTKLVDYQIKYGFTWREALIKYEYDPETADPLTETHYDYSKVPFFRKLYSKTVWTYE